MLASRTKKEEAEYKEYIQGIKRLGFYFIMRRNSATGIWYVVGPKVPFPGLAAAQEGLERYKASGYDGRSSDLKVEAVPFEQQYRQVWNEVKRWLKKMGYPMPPEPPWRYNKT